MSDIRQRIFDAEDLKREPLEIPEWGITAEDGVCIKSLTSAELDAWEASNTIKVGNEYQGNRENMKARYLVRCLIGPDDKRIFSDADAKQLGEKNGAIVDRIWEKAARLNGVISDELKELAKNSASDQSEDSGCSSPEPSSIEA